MKTLLLRWAVIVIAVFLVAWGLPKTGLFGDTTLISYNDDWGTLAIFAAVLALLNTFVRPILAFISIPFTCLTGGLFLIVINIIMLAGALHHTPMRGELLSYEAPTYFGMLVAAYKPDASCSSRTESLPASS